MSLDRALQLNTATLAAIGALFLGLGHENPAVPLGLGAAAVVAFLVTDVRRWLLLNRMLGNLIALVAVAWSLRKFVDLGSGDQLLAIANMLVCLQVVLLFQDKTARVFWQLLVLSLLQVVVAAALSLGPLFGLILGPYVVLAVTQLVLLCIDRDWERGPGGPRPASAPAAGEPWRVLLLPPTSRPAGASAEDLRLNLGGWTIARHVALLTVATLLFTAVFFYATPRLSDTPWQGAGGRRAVSGLPSEVRIKESGQIQLSDQVVMRVLLTRLNDRRPAMLVGEPYFTGSTLTQYQSESEYCRWIPPPRPVRTAARAGLGTASPSGKTPGGVRPFGQGLPPGPRQTSNNLIRQDIVLELGRTPSYPAILPALDLRDSPKELRYRRVQNRLERQAVDLAAPAREYRYTFATSAIRNGRQVHGIVHPSFASTESELYALVEFDSRRFEKLAETAAQAIREQGAEQGTQLDRALALERHFHTPDLYRYSLQLDFERNRELDPFEDFVANHRTGYCEYFAGALALMLRSQGIPARMIIGYKGGELNPLGHYYVVKQRHAHAWVEAWVPTADVPEWEVAGIPSDGGVWYRLDPTPAAREMLTSVKEETLARRVTDAFDYMDLLWRDYVLALNRSRQEDTFFDPLTARATALPAWLEARSFQRWLRRWSARVGLDSSPASRRGGPQAFESGLAVLVAGGLLLVFGAVQAVRFAGRSLGRWWSMRTKQVAAVGHAPAFYLRLERLLAHLSLRRRAGETARELATAAQQRLNTKTQTRPAAHIPAEVVAAYYRVRFGSARLDKEQTAAIEHALDTLTPAVSQASR